MGLSAMAGCKTETETGGDKISESDPWFDVATIEIETYEGSMATDVDIEFADDTEVLFTKYDIWSDGDLPAHELFSCDYSGNVTTICDLTQVALNADVVYSTRVIKFGPDIYLYGMSSDDEGKLVRIDRETGGAEEVPGDVPEQLLADVTSDDGSYVDFKNTGDTLVAVVRQWNMTTSAEELAGVYVIDSDWTVTSLYVSEVKDYFGEGIGVECYLSDSGKIMFFQEDMDIGTDIRQPVVFDTSDSSMTVVAEDSPYDDFDLAWTGNTLLRDGMVYAYDIDSDSAEECFDLSWANVNRRNIWDMTLSYADGEKLVFADDGSQIRGGETSKIYMLRKADKNPNAGKTLLTVATIAEDSAPDRAVCEAIVNFNNESDDTYVQIDYTYGYTEYDYENEDYQEYLLDNDTNICDVLTLDIKSGNAPDIIVAAGSRISMNDGTLFVDLNDYIDGNKGIDRDDYFGNIFEGAEINGSLYHIPVSVYLNAITVTSDLAGEAVSGMTYEEYEEFLSDELNGVNILSFNADRVLVFLDLFEEMGDTFISDGKITIDNDEFCALAEFCKENVDEKSYWERMADDYETASGIMNSSHAQASIGYRLSLNEFLQYSSNMNADELSLIANPTMDGSMPSIALSDTMGITQCCEAKDRAWEFVKYVMENYTATDSSMGVPVRRAACDEFMASSVESMKSEMEEFETGHAGGLTEDLANVYKTAMEKSEFSRMSDSATETILKEEMPAYFAGQKTIDEVISVVTDRVQTIYDERD